MYMINRPIMERGIVESNPLPEHNWVSEKLHNCLGYFFPFWKHTVLTVLRHMYY